MNDINKVKELRKATGAGFKDCNNALKETKGEIQKAIELLRIKGISKASKKMSRSANEGVISLSGDEKNTSLIEVNCETDFVAKNESFISFVKELSIINHNLSSNSVKIKNTLMQNKKSVDENLVELISKIGEKITLGRSYTLNHPESINFTYMHNVVTDSLSKLAVVTSLETKDSNNEKFKLFGKQLSMHIAASNPLAINSEDIDEEIIMKEKQLISEELKKSGKASNIIDKIALGKISKFKSDNSLLSQDWVIDPKKKVSDIISELKIKDLKIKKFIRIKIGE